MDFHLHQRVIDVLMHYLKVNNLRKQGEVNEDTDPIQLSMLTQSLGDHQDSVAVMIEDGHTSLQVLTHSLIYSLTHSLTYSLTLVRPLNYTNKPTRLCANQQNTG